MRVLDPLYAGALLCGIAAALWALHVWIPFAFALGIIVFVAAAITLLFVRRLAPHERRVVRGGATVALAAHALLILVVLLEQPFGFGRDPATAFTWDPPAWAAGLGALYAPTYLFLICALVVVTFFPLWRTPERVLGVAGAALALLVITIGGRLAGDAAAPGALPLLLALGFALLAGASLAAPLRSTYPPWVPLASGQRGAGSAATGNP